MNPSEEREKITGEIRFSLQEENNAEKALKSTKDVQAFLEKEKGRDVSSFLSLLLAGAVIFQASDLHAEAEKDKIKIRFRIDGLLQDVLEISAEWYASLLSRIKLVSGIKLNVADRPQDGRFSFLIESKEPIEVRAATLPSEYGESLVLRILNPQSLVSLKELGLRKDLLELFAKEIKKPNGMIIVTGPTGSVKTSTLYAFLQEVKNPEAKIVTIEDPIEYHIQGVNQTQVNPAKGYDFASGLRAIVRQDPDIILVGEVRDGETAEIALQAALTGHLVFSTLHANDASGTVARLLALGSKASTIASALELIIAQRLVRKVCEACAKFQKPNEKELGAIGEALNALKLPKEKSLMIPRAQGCKECSGTGYKGRIGIFEAIAVDDQMEEFILSSDSSSSLKAFAVKKGMVPMRQDGILKVLKGITTLEEVERVAEE
ncbi:MAG: type II/IV secretion system protein [Candidatus Wildermuthbacteria bacterium]|nr:type II/IV secretion system protein [Candidatus Wildermuthbacteria bacterium]